AAHVGEEVSVEKVTSAEKMTSADDLSLESTKIVTEVTTSSPTDRKELVNLSYFSIADFETYSKIWSCWTSLRFYPDGHILVKTTVENTELSQLPFNSAVINLHLLTFRNRLVPVSIGLNYPSEEVNFVFDAILALDKLYTIERFGANEIVVTPVATTCSWLWAIPRRDQFL
ncbi:hypothetical protein KPH14_013060, partial [Odynerus spinipes]